MSSNRHATIVRHWLPKVTRCPLSPFPDLVYLSAEFVGGPKDFVELYDIRRTMSTVAPFGTKIFMEDLAMNLLRALPTAKSVTVRLLFNRHVATITREELK